MPLILVLIAGFPLLFAPGSRAEETPESASADSECILNLAEVPPGFNDNSPAGPATLDEKARQLTQTVSLPDGVTVSYSAGGCVHYGFSYRYGNIKTMPQTLNKEAFALVRGHVSRTPVYGDAEFMPRMIDSIEQALKSPDEHIIFSSPSAIEIHFGDALAGLELFPDGFEISYDFPL